MIVVTTEDGTRVDVNLHRMEFSAMDINGVHLGQGRLVVRPRIVPGCPLVLGMATGTVEFYGTVTGVVYRA